MSTESADGPPESSPPQAPQQAAPAQAAPQQAPPQQQPGGHGAREGLRLGLRLSEPTLSSRSSSASSRTLHHGAHHHNHQDDVDHGQPDTRTHVVVELYETERNYVDALDFLVKEYMQPLKRSENAGMVDSELVEQIFYQVPAILCHHREFLEDLQKRLENWDFHQKVGDVLLNAFTKRSVIDTYTAFINNWKTAKEAIKSTCQAKPAFARYLEAMSREHKGRLALDSLLIKPVQRIPRYELLIARLLKHTDPSHADHSQLLDAQREIHELAVKINCTERESLEQEQQQQTLRDLEALVDGCDLVAQGRVFLRHDCVTLASNTGQGQGTRKERVLFLFSDLVVIARTKRNIRKPSAAGSSTSVASGLEGNRYRCSMKAALDDLEIVKAKDESLRRVMREMEQLSEDVAALTQITELASSLHLPHAPQQPPPQQQQQQQQQLEELARELLSSACRQLAERQNSDSQLSCLDLTVNTSNGVENITVIFTKPDKRSSWEETFNEAKTRLALSADRRPSPKFKTSVPIRKTRAGLQFTCAAPTLAGPGCAGAAPATGAGAAPGVSPGAAAGLRDVWVCNSDGYVGQVCVLSLVPEPNVTSCNGVCNARILCVAAIPATPPATAPSSTSPSLSCPSQLTNSKAGISISVEDTDQAARNLHLDSSSSSDEFDDDNDSGSAPEERLRSNTADSQASAPPQRQRRRPSGGSGRRCGGRGRGGPGLGLVHHLRRRPGAAHHVAGHGGRLHPRVQLQRQHPHQEEQGQDPARRRRALHHVLRQPRVRLPGQRGHHGLQQGPSRGVEHLGPLHGGGGLGGVPRHAHGTHRGPPLVQLPAHHQGPQHAHAAGRTNCRRGRQQPVRHLLRRLRPGRLALRTKLSSIKALPRVHVRAPRGGERGPGRHQNARQLRRHHSAAQGRLPARHLAAGLQGPAVDRHERGGHPDHAPPPRGARHHQAHHVAERLRGPPRAHGPRPLPDRGGGRAWRHGPRGAAARRAPQPALVEAQGRPGRPWRRQQAARHLGRRRLRGLPHVQRVRGGRQGGLDEPPAHVAGVSEHSYGR